MSRGGWRSHVIGQIVAGPIEVWCCDRRVAVWWRDTDSRDRDWKMFAGRPSPTRDRRTNLYGGIGPSLARMCCDTCRLDFQRGMAVLGPSLDQMAAADAGRVELATLVHVL